MSVHVVNPAASGTAAEVSPAPRPATLAGTTLGVLINGKEYSEQVLRRVAAHLTAEHGVREVLFWDKHFPAVPAPESFLEEITARCTVAVAGVGHCGASTTNSVLDCLALEDRGVPSVVMLSDHFAPVGRAIAAQRGLPGIAVAEISHPLGDPDPAKVDAKADAAAGGLAWSLLNLRPAAAPAAPQAAGELVDIPQDAADAFDVLSEMGWTDGLPVIPPTPELVTAAVRAAGRDPEETIALIPPLKGAATVRSIAANAVLAGCRPEYLPVVLAAVEAVADEKYGLVHRQITTHAGAPLIIVNGPIAKRLAVNGSTGVFGPGWRANSTIGRALRLVLQNIGGAIPGVTDMSQHAHPGKYTYCIAEDEDANPWTPLHVERGFGRQQNAVTVVNAEAPHSATDNVTASARQTLTTCASVFATLGSNNLYSQGEPVLALGREHAAGIAAEGWSKLDVKTFIYERARQPWKLVRGRGKSIGPNWPKWLDQAEDDDMVPVVTAPDDLIVVVCGGAGGKSMVIPTAGAQSLSVTREITMPA
ncbi:MAG TPA: hypothetical protein VGM53_06710 [Streptosporangiaceae bacterium]|jgi:hypothetical protein